MCRILAFAAPTDSTFSSVLGDQTCMQFQMLARVHGDGWGAMWLANGVGGMTLRRFRAGHNGRYDDGLRRALAVPAARAGVVHLRMATDGLTVQVTNSHPFVDRGIGLAHNGTISPVADLRELVAPETLGRLRGTTDSEMYLALVTDRVRAGLSFLDAVRASVALLRDVFPTASLNAVLLSRSHMVVVHSSTHAHVPTENFHGRLLAGEELPPHHDAGYYLMQRLRGPDGTLAYASSGFDQESWEPLPPNSIAIVDLATMSETTEPVALLGPARRVPRQAPPAHAALTAPTGEGGPPRGEATTRSPS